jgi:hypothetical protein
LQAPHIITEQHKKDGTILVDLSTRAISPHTTAAILRQISPITAPSFVTVISLKHANILFDNLLVATFHHEWP